VLQVADLIGGSKSKASRVVDHLVERGLVDRRDDDRDRRARQLTMTGKGHELLAAFENSVTEAQFARIERLSPDEIDLVIRAIDLMTSPKAQEAQGGNQP
jgi:DNA-binding MarR family transcriptional regulator